jgi:hypothetical protein
VSEESEIDPEEPRKRGEMALAAKDGKRRTPMINAARKNAPERRLMREILPIEAFALQSDSPR